MLDSRDFARDRRILFVSIDTFQLFCVPAFLMLSVFFLTNKLENPNNPAQVVKKDSQELYHLIYFGQ
jgi:hypothetical protein